MDDKEIQHHKNTILNFLQEKQTADDNGYWALYAVEKLDDALILEMVLHKCTNVPPSMFFHLVDFMQKEAEIKQQQAVIRCMRLLLSQDFDPWKVYGHKENTWTFLQYVLHSAIFSHSENLYNNVDRILDLLTFYSAQNISKLFNHSLCSSTYKYLNSPFENSAKNISELPLVYLVRQMMIVSASIYDFSQINLCDSENRLFRQDVMSRIINISGCLVRIGGNPFHVHELVMRGLYGDKFNASPLSLIVLLGVAKEQLPPPSTGVPIWERYVYRDVESENCVNSMAIGMIKSYCAPTEIQKHLERRNLHSFLILNQENQEQKLPISLLDLIVLCGRYNIFHKISEYAVLFLPNDMMNLVMSAYTVMTRKGHNDFIIFFHNCLGLKLTKYPICLQIPNHSTHRPILKSFNPQINGSRPVPYWTNGQLEKYNEFLVPYEIISTIMGEYMIHQPGEIHNVRFTRKGNFLVTKLIKI
jgi:hypothetical protein